MTPATKYAVKMITGVAKVHTTWFKFPAFSRKLAAYAA